MSREHAAVIIGGSFAGLGCAYFLDDAEKVIIEAKKEIGAAQTSTCCTSLNLMERLGCKGVVLQKFEHFVLHSPDGHELYVKLPEKFCTIDYSLFCKLLTSRLKNCEIKTGKKAKEITNNAVLCSDNEAFGGKAIIDASGWQSISFERVEKARLAFGIEIEGKIKDIDNSAFHLFYGKRYIEKGYAWIFPVSESAARIGLGGFDIKNPNEMLKKFLKEIKITEVEKAQKHANYIPCIGLRERPEQNIFCVGDSLFQVLPLSAEGIRKSIEYAECCAFWIKKMINNETTLEEALDNYYNEVYMDKKFYDNLAFAQALAIYLPEFLRERIITNLSKVNEERLKHIVELYLSSGIKQDRAKIVGAILKAII